MLRLINTALRDCAKKLIRTNVPKINCNESNWSNQVRCISAIVKQVQGLNSLKIENSGTSLLSNSLNKLLIPKAQPSLVPCRTVIKYSLTKGKRKSVKTVLKRFYRLNWGIWIRTKAGRHKRLWKKSAARRRRLRQHVFTNAQQSWMLDKMVTKFWKRPKYYVDDPYEPYHSREEFPFTQKKPKPLPYE